MLHMLPDVGKALLEFVQRRDPVMTVDRDSAAPDIAPSSDACRSYRYVCLWNRSLVSALERKFIPDAKYGPYYKAVEAYEIRQGILMMPRYLADGQVCEIGLERLHYAPETIRLDSSLSRKETDQTLDELVPPGETGPKSKNPLGTLITQTGQSLSTNIDFENVSIQIYGSASDGNSGTGVGEIAATIKWKSRKCQ